MGQPFGKLLECGFASISRNVHDLASVLDDLRHFLHREIRPLRIQGKVLVKLLFARFDQSLKDNHPGIVHQNIEVSKALHHVSNETARIGYLAHISLERNRLAAL